MGRVETVMVSGRVPVVLRDRVAARAELERRSFTGQLIWLLERGLAEPAGMMIDDLDDLEVPVAVGAPPVEPQPDGGELAGPGGVGQEDAIALSGSHVPGPGSESESLIMSALREAADRKPFRPDFKQEPKKGRQ